MAAPQPNQLPSQRPALAGLLLLLIGYAPTALALAGGASKCSACRAVAEELITRLDAEVPRNHLDMRHRLDKDGKRWGPVIDYKMSELRVIHLLEDLCKGLGHKYQQVPDPAGGADAQRWARSDSLAASQHWDLPEAQRKQHRRSLENFCSDLIEQHEDDLSHALRQARVDADSASDFLCHVTAKHCDRTLLEEEAAWAAVEAAASAEKEEDYVPAAAREQQQQQGGEQAAPEADTAEASTAGNVKREEL